MLRIANGLPEQLIAATDTADRSSLSQHATGKPIEASLSDEVQSLHRLFRPWENHGIQRTLRRFTQANQFHIRFPGQRVEVREIGNARHIHNSDHDPVYPLWRPALPAIP